MYESAYRIKSALTVMLFITASLACLQVVYAKQQKTEKALQLSEVIDNIVRHYPSLDVAAIEIQRARQEFAKVESQLGWVLSARAGMSRDLSFIDSPTDRYAAGVGVGRTFESGSSIELSGAYSHDDSDATISPLLPNPVERTDLDLKYRIPFAQGKDNPQYAAGLLTARSGLSLQEANQRLLVDNLIQQSMLLYYDLLFTYIRIKDAQRAIDRAQRLMVFIDKNRKLGLSEKKDILRVESQLKRQVAQFDSLQVVWYQQRTELNRLMGLPPNQELIPAVSHAVNIDVSEYQKILETVYRRNPELNLQRSQLELAAAEIALAKDEKRDQLDLILSVGNRNVSGDVLAGSVDDNEVVGAAQLEYRYSFDKQGFDANLYQAMLQKEKAEKEIKRIEDDLRYQVDSLLAQVSANKRAVKSNLAHYKVEQQKIEEAFARYKQGRATTNELIDFEESLQVSYLLHQNQKVTLSRSIANLSLLMGLLWDESTLNNRVEALSSGGERQ